MIRRTITTTCQLSLLHSSPIVATAVLALSVFCVSRAAEAQQGVSDPPNVFLDCNTRSCDFDHFRREITWVNWVRDRTDSEIHLLVTSQQTGGRGSSFTLDFIVEDGTIGVTKSLTYVSDATDTDAEVRTGLTRTIAVGLVSFVETSVLAQQLQIDFQQPVTAQAQDTSDPWNLWVFRIGSEVSFEGESQERSYQLEGFVAADRVAEDLKINFRSEIEYSREEFDELDDGETFINSVTDYSADLLMVWSLTDKWSAGGTIEARKSTFRNQDLGVAIGPAVEYNIFPYSESTRRSLTFRYAVEVESFNYELLTVEGKTAETLPRHSLRLSADVQQPWGEIFGSVTGLQYLHDPATHRIDTFVRLEYRLFRGLNLDLSGSFDRIKDQFFLPAESLTPEEILVRRRQRETDFRFDFSIGFSYRFGSRFANVVNPRMD